MCLLTHRLCVYRYEEKGKKSTYMYHGFVYTDIMLYALEATHTYIEVLCMDLYTVSTYDLLYAFVFIRIFYFLKNSLRYWKKFQKSYESCHVHIYGMEMR